MDITTFFYQQKQIRIMIDENGEPYWILNDICHVLGLTNPSMVIQQLDQDERSKENLGRQGETWIINEPGLYSLIIRSNKPEAKIFKRWLTHEVLPAIRKQGAYSIQHQIPKSFAEALQLAADQARQLEEQRPMVQFVESYVDATGLFTLTATAKKCKIPRKDLIETLLRDRVVFRRQKRLEPYLHMVEKGYFEIKSGLSNGGHAYDQLYITARGVQWITETYMSELAA